MGILANLSNRMIIEDTLCCDCSDVQVSNCDLSRMSVESARWMSNTINNSNAPNIEFLNSALEDITFYRSNFEKSSYNKTSFVQSNFSGVTLIKSEWSSCKLQGLTIKHCTLQRAMLDKCIFSSSALIDFEGLDMEMSNCFFKDCKFELSSEGGMNGFSSANINSCIFLNCDFSGFPLRGANVNSCIFNNCTGYISDDISMQNTLGLESLGKCSVKEKTLSNIDAANEFLKKWR